MVLKLLSRTAKRSGGRRCKTATEKKNPQTRCSLSYLFRIQALALLDSKKEEIRYAKIGPACFIKNIKKMHLQQRVRLHSKLFRRYPTTNSIIVGCFPLWLNSTQKHSLNWVIFLIQWTVFIKVTLTTCTELERSGPIFEKFLEQFKKFSRNSRNF